MNYALEYFKKYGTTPACSCGVHSFAEPEPTPKILLDAFNLPPAQAIKFLKDKGFVFSWDWHEIWQEAHDQSFTVAKVMKADILQDIRDSVESAIENGTTFQEFRNNLQPILEAKGWWGKQVIDETTVQLGSPHRLKTIFRTNINTAQMAGRYKAQKEVLETRPFWQYIAIKDSRTRRKHLALDGKIFRHDDPFWNKFYPPIDWGCRCYVRTFSQSELERESLTVESSKGTLSQEEVLISIKSGKKANVSVYTDPLTKSTTMVGAGWDYNPGKSIWKPEKKKYDTDIRKLT